ncbi:kinase-like domain-containing protein [Xylariaceae sp. FL1651]|nr:kinase-like domain-containing protein [Xylariaceae sp. FL1651]
MADILIMLDDKPVEVLDGPHPPGEIWPGWATGLPNIPRNSGRIENIKNCGIKFKDDRSSPIFPLKLLQHLFSVDVLTEELSSFLGNREARDHLVRKILGSREEEPRYLQIFAILKLIRREKKIQQFIDCGICDQHLPLECDDRDNDRLYRTNPREPLPEDILDPDERDSFWSWQWSVVVPFFKPQLGPFDFHGRQQMPYYEVRADFSHNLGGSGEVSKIRMHPLCHEFPDLRNGLQGPDEEQFFAQKRFHTKSENDLEEFQREVKMLQKFNGKKHPNLVTMLAAYKHRGGQFLLFPWATCDLLNYWENIEPEPNNTDPTTVRWVSRQAWMLVEAVKCIHFPRENMETAEGDHRWGRHGDLKPENVLWFRGRSGRGTLVISDMGLSQEHRFMSRSNVPKNVKKTPKYRPPECDYEGGKISRTFDIWTLGCIFLEMLTWLSGGYILLQDMEESRTTSSIRGFASDEFFEWVEVEGVNFRTIRVKKAVTEVSSHNIICWLILITGL